MRTCIERMYRAAIRAMVDLPVQGAAAPFAWRWKALAECCLGRHTVDPTCGKRCHYGMLRIVLKQQRLSAEITIHMRRRVRGTQARACVVAASNMWCLNQDVN